MSTRKNDLEAQLMPLSPSRLEITDLSAAHQGHQGAPKNEQETHLSLLVVSDKFSGKTRIERQRMIHQCLAGQFSQGLHALTIKALTPEEAG